jgi:hypothetical protein
VASFLSGVKNKTSHTTYIHSNEMTYHPQMFLTSQKFVFAISTFMSYIRRPGRRDGPYGVNRTRDLILTVGINRKIIQIAEK